ncbi:MAG: cytochrome C oxidase subunit IV family protein [Acidimicrobiia bacterium]
MSTDHSVQPPSSEHHPAYPTPSQYWKIAVLLAALTAIEVALYYINRQLDLGMVNSLALIILAFLKFVIVVGWYMHLRYEKSTLNRFFVAGFVLAGSLYLTVLVALGVVAIRGS